MREEDLSGFFPETRCATTARTGGRDPKSQDRQCSGWRRIAARLISESPAWAPTAGPSNQYIDQPVQLIAAVLARNNEAKISSGRPARILDERRINPCC